MADTKINSLTELTTIAEADLIAIIDDTGGTPTEKKMTRKLLFQSMALDYGLGTELTISSGTVTRTANYHTIDTEADASTDDLTDINGGDTGEPIIIRSNNNARDPTLIDNAGDFRLVSDFTLTHVRDSIFLFNNNTTFVVEISRSNNA